MSILNSNDYNRGIKDGYDDGFKDIPKRYFKSGLSWKFAIHGSHAIDTYNQGYNEGYRKGCIARLEEEKKNENEAKNNTEQQTLNTHQTTISNNIKSNSMQRGIDGQIELLEQMKNFLSNLTQQFDEITKTQESFVRDLDSEGLDFKLLENFENSVEDNRNKINALISDIENEQIPYTEKVIRHLEDTPR